VFNDWWCHWLKVCIPSFNAIFRKAPVKISNRFIE